MKYVALLRGINVGGNNIIKMSELKKTVESYGFSDVITYIQSGNVIFETPEMNIQKITKKLEIKLSENFGYSARVVVRSLPQLQEIVSEVPRDWKSRDDIRCYVAFVKEPTTSDEIVSEIVLKKDIDFIKAGQGVVYMTTLLSGITKSGFSKLAGKKIYKNLTIRNYNTTKRLVELMS